MALEIRKKNIDNIWTHQKDGGNEIVLSKGHFRFVGLNFELTEPTGSDNIRGVVLADIKVYDETDSGAEEVFNTVVDCVTRLKQLDYPFFRDTDTNNNAASTDKFATLTEQTITFPDSQTAYILDFTVLPVFTTLNPTDLIAVYNYNTSSYGVITKNNLCISCGTTTTATNEMIYTTPENWDETYVQ